MPGIMRPVPESSTWIFNQFPNLNMQPWVMAHIKSRWIIISVVIWTPIFWWSSFHWNIMVANFNEALVRSISVAWIIIRTVAKRNDYIKAALPVTIACAWILIHTVVKRDAYFKAVLLVCIDSAALLVVNARYISVVVIPIAMTMVFVRALYVVVTPKRYLKSDKDSHNEDYNKAGGIGTSSKAESNGDAGEMAVPVKGLFATAVLPLLVLSCMVLHSNAENMVVSQFLLFLTSTLGELSVMMAKLPPKVAKAFEIMRRSSIVLALVTAHTLAAELLGDDVVLVYMPELITFLIWFCIHLCHGSGVKSPISINKVTSHRNGIFFVTSVVIAGATAAWLPIFMDGSEVATDMFCTYMWSVLVYCSCSVILLSLCVFALHQWPGKTTAAPSLELKGAITLLSWNIMIITTVGSLATLVYLHLCRSVTTTIN